MKILFKIKPWTWECGDGCCSDSGCDIEVYPLGSKCSPFYNKEIISYPYPTFNCIPPGIVIDCLYDFTKEMSCPEFRAKVFEAYGVEDNVTDWHWSSGLPTLDADSVVKIFAHFGFECTIREEDNEER